jgi:calcineurin-like phosphoesterase
VRILLIGDIVGNPGRAIVQRAVRGLIAREGLDLVIANGENAAAGSGITRCRSSRVDCLRCGTQDRSFVQKW